MVEPGGERIGFVGLGSMGMPMVRNLLRAGYAVTIANRSKTPVEELVAEGAKAARTPLEVAERCDSLVTMLPASADVAAVLCGKDGVLSGAHEGLLWVDMSSIAPSTTREVAAQCARVGVHCLDAPVSGGVKGAREGRLAIMVGGEGRDVERARPILEVLGKNVVHVGPVGAGQVAKIANQVIVAGTIAVVAEALALATASGVNPVTVIAALQGGFADSPILRNHGERMVSEAFAAGFRLQLQLKDVELAMDLAQELGIHINVTSCVRDLVAEAVAKGLGDLDHAALAKVAGRARS